MYNWTFCKLYALAISARMSGNDDQFLNEVLQYQKQLPLPGIHVKLIVQHFEIVIQDTGLRHAEASYSKGSCKCTKSVSC